MGDWTYINSFEQLNEVTPILLKAPTLFCDVESTGLDSISDTLLLVQFFTGEHSYLFDARLVNLFPLFANLQAYYDKDIVFHNAKFDLKFLKKNYNFVPQKVFCTMVAEAFLHHGLERFRASLAKLAQKYLEISLSKEERTSFLDQVGYFTTEQLNYAAKDTIVLSPIYDIQKEKIKEISAEKIAEIEFELIKVVVDMELLGVRFDESVWEDCFEQATVLMAKADEELRQTLAQAGEIEIPAKKPYTINAGDINLKSPQQVLPVLRALGIKTESTSFEALSNEEHPAAVQLLRHRRFTKKVTTYGRKFTEKYLFGRRERIHSDFNQVGTATGRFSSDNPNLQNIPNPKKDPDNTGLNYRKAFIPTEGYVMITADYSQIELRITAQVSKESVWINAFRNNEDPHSNTATLIYKIDLKEVTPEFRSVAKNTNFATLYGSGAWNLSRKFQIPINEAEKLIENFFNGHPQLKAFIAEQGDLTISNRYSQTIFGRRRQFLLPSYNDPKFRNKVFAIRREGVNHIIQGSSADMLKMAMIYLHKNLGQVGGRILMTIHDEIVMECPKENAAEAKDLIKLSMIKAGEEMITEIPVLVDVNVGDAWEK